MTAMPTLPEDVYTPTQEDQTRLNWMDRVELEALLESHSIQCYDNESDLDLKNAIIANLSDGEISPDELPEWK